MAWIAREVGVFNELSLANFIYTKPQFFFSTARPITGPSGPGKEGSVKHLKQRPKKNYSSHEECMRLRYSRPDPDVLLISLWLTVKQLRGFGQNTLELAVWDRFSLRSSKHSK